MSLFAHYWINGGDYIAVSKRPDKVHVLCGVAIDHVTNCGNMDWAMVDCKDCLNHKHRHLYELKYTVL